MANIEKRVSGNGEITYRVKVRLKGYPAQSATFERITDAKTWASKAETDIKEGRYFKYSEARKHTLQDLITRYQRDVLPRKSKNSMLRQNQKAQLDWWAAQLGPYTLTEITPAKLAECRDKLANGETNRGEVRSPSTVVRYMAALSHAFGIAVKEWGWLEDNPMRKVSKPKEPRGRVRFLSDDERIRLLEACRESDNALLYPLVVLAVSTGMRQGEILGLTWADVNLDKHYLILHETKNGERRRVPLAGHAHEVVKKLGKIRRIDTDLVFPHLNPRLKGQPFDLRKPWDDALKAAKLKDFRFHDLRHCTASYLAMNGASLAEIAEVLGHKTLQMVKRYAHLSEAHTSKVVAAMNERIFG